MTQLLSGKVCYAHGSPQGNGTAVLMIGTLLDQRYQIIQVLGQGGFGHTYVAEDTRRPGNPTCVVKHLKPATSDPEFLQIARRLFNSEAETLEKLGTHDQIPRLLAYFEENQEFYLVEEFIAGHPLSTELPLGKQWNESQVIQLLQEVLPILEFVHTNRVIHRDLKPDNLIRRDQDNKLVLVDFGAVKQVQMQSVIAQEGIKETVAIGTPGYMPSEQGQGRPRPNSDIYALGMIGIQALTGMNPTQLSEDVDTGEIIWREHAQVSDGLAAVLNNMVRHYFKYRYQSATEVLQALQPLANPHPLKTLAVVVSQRVRYFAKESYQSTTEVLRTIQYQSASKLLRMIEPLANPQILPGKTAAPGNPPQPRSSTPASVNSGEQTVTVAPGNPLRSQSSSQFSWGSISRSPQKLVLFMGAGTATLVIAVSAISANRQPPLSPAATQNRAEITPSPSQPEQDKSKSEPDKSKSEPDKSKSEQDKSKSEQKKSCVVVLDSSNVRSKSGRSRTGQVIKAGTTVTVTGKEEDGWIEISSPVEGWIWKSRTKSTNTCSPS